MAKAKCGNTNGTNETRWGSGQNESINAELYANMDEAVNQLNALPHSQW